MTKQMDVFKKNLEEFAAKHKDDIRKDPQFRLQFQEMCASIGVDPLACKYPHSAIAIRLTHLINLSIVDDELMLNVLRCHLTY